MDYDVIIIGAGIGGLAAGLELSSAGKKVLILEQQPVAGGFATAFRRKGFVFESSLHCVDALGKEGEVRKYLEEKGVAQKIEFLELKDFMRVAYPEHDFVADFNPDNLLNYLLTAFPAEEKGIRALFSESARFRRQFEKFSFSRFPYWLQMVLSPFIYPAVVKASCLSAEQFLDRYIKDKKLKAILADIWRYMGLPPSRLSALYYLVVFTSFYYERTAYVRGGYPRLIAAVAERIKENGGELRSNEKAIKVVPGAGNTMVITEAGKEYRAACVISNANAQDTLCKLVDDSALNNKYRKRFSEMERSVSAFQVYLGLRVPARQLGMDHFMLSVNTSYDQDANYRFSFSGDYAHVPLTVVDHAQLDPELVPPGKGSLLIMILDAFSNWAALDEDEYKKKKAEVAEKLVQRVQAYLPGLAAQIEVIEAATPLTMQRYSLCPEGAIYGFAQTVEQSAIARLAQETEIKGLFLAGAWTRPGGGAHACFVSGWDAAGLALKYLKRSVK